MLTAEDIMTRDVVTVSPDTEIAHAARLLLEKGFNGLPVVEESGKLVGILCRTDLIVQQKRLPVPSVFTLLDGLIPLTSAKHMEKAFQKIAAIRVADAMTPDPARVRPQTTIEEVAALMVDRKFHTLPVVDEKGDLVGVVGKEDVLKTLVQGQSVGAP
jgi:CBS-domain-containing membrane protein